MIIILGNPPKMIICISRYISHQGFTPLYVSGRAAYGGLISPTSRGDLSPLQPAKMGGREGGGRENREKIEETGEVPPKIGFWLLAAWGF